MYSNEFYKNLLENLYEAVYFVDCNRKIIFWNKGAERITGFSATEVEGDFCYNNLLNHVDDEGNKLCLGGCPLHKTIEDGKMRECSLYLHHKNGHRVPISIRTIPIYEKDKIIGAVEVFNDNIEKHELLRDVENLKRLAMKDELTKLWNRRYLDTFLNARMNEFKKFGIPFGVAFFDIDRFRLFNDTYGHDVGDQVLKMVAKTFQNNLSSTDIIGRWGGEEFVGSFSGVDEKGLLKITENIRMLVENSFIRTKGKRLNVTISIGATIIKESDTVEEAIKRADELLYVSKSSGRNKVTIR